MPATLFFLFNAATVTINVVNFHFFTCESNKSSTGIATANLIMYITFTLLGLCGAIRSTRRENNGNGAVARIGILQPAVISFFISVQAWSAISETNELCPRDVDDKGNDVMTSIFGMTAVVAVVMYISRMNSPSAATVADMVAQEERAEQEAGAPPRHGVRIVDDEKDAPVYNWALFHFALAFGALYVSNLLADWGRPGGASEEDQKSEFQASRGETPVWVQAAFSWVTGLIYLWWTLTPQCFPDRDWSSCIEASAGSPSQSGTTSRTATSSV